MVLVVADDAEDGEVRTEHRLGVTDPVVGGVRVVAEVALDRQQVGASVHDELQHGPRLGAGALVADEGDGDRFGAGGRRRRERGAQHEGAKGAPSGSEGRVRGHAVYTS